MLSLFCFLAAAPVADAREQAGVWEAEFNGEGVQVAGRVDFAENSGLGTGVLQLKFCKHPQLTNNCGLFKDEIDVTMDRVDATTLTLHIEENGKPRHNNVVRVVCILPGARRREIVADVAADLRATVDISSCLEEPGDDEVSFAKRQLHFIVQGSLGHLFSVGSLPAVGESVDFCRADDFNSANIVSDLELVTNSGDPLPEVGGIYWAGLGVYVSTGELIFHGAAMRWRPANWASFVRATMDPLNPFIEDVCQEMATSFWQHNSPATFNAQSEIGAYSLRTQQEPEADASMSTLVVGLAAGMAVSFCFALAVSACACFVVARSRKRVAEVLAARNTTTLAHAQPGTARRASRRSSRRGVHAAANM